MADFYGGPDSLRGLYTWHVVIDGTWRQYGGGVDCGIQHARMIGEEIYQLELSQRGRLREIDLQDHTPSIKIGIARDGDVVELFNGKQWRAQ